MRYDSEDTIAAISTPQGVGGIGIIRISGSQAIEKANKIFNISPWVNRYDAAKEMYRANAMQIRCVKIE